MTELSITQAIQAFVDGKEVQHTSAYDNKWNTLSINNSLNLFKATGLKFRLKPEILTVSLTYTTPIPFTPRIGEIYWYISPSNDPMYSHNTYTNQSQCKNRVLLGVYRTEDEIKLALDNQLHALSQLNSQ